MKITKTICMIAALLLIAAPVGAKNKSDQGFKKVIAIGHVNTSRMGFSSLTPKQLGDLFKMRAKKELEKTGRYIVIIPKYEEEDIDAEQKAAPQKTPKTAAEAMKYAQEMQKQFEIMAAKAQGQYVHKPVAAQALFNFSVSTGSRHVTTGGLFSEIEYLSGAPLGGADFSSDSLHLTLTCYDLDPESGKIEADYQAKASSTKVARVGGVSYYTMEDTSNPDRAFDRMFKRSLGKCISWIDKRMSGQSWEGQVFKKQGSKLFVNAGSNAGITPGTIFGAYGGGAISGKGISVSAGGTQTGTIEITDVFDTYSTAKVVSGTAGDGSLIRRKDN